MTKLGTVSRFMAVLTVVVALAGVGGGVSAQDGQEQGTVDQSVAEETSPYYVGVSCWPAADNSQTTCSFTGYASDGAAVEALWVPAWIACAEVSDASGTELTWTGDGYHVYSDNLTLTFAGSVTPGDTAGYVIRVDGSPVEVTGDGLVCGDATAAWTVGAPETTNEGDTGESTADGSVDKSTEDGSVAYATVDAAENDGATPVATDQETVESDPGATEEAPQTNVAGDPVDVTVTVYNCSSDPGAEDPGSYGDCELAGTTTNEVDVSATENGNDLGTQTTSGGVTTFSVTEGSSLVVSEAVPDGFNPIGNGTATIDPVTEGAAVVFVNVAEDILGRLQIVNGLCPASEPTDTEFFVVPPKSLQAAAEPSCEPTAGAVFVITGGTLPDGGIQAFTDEHGIWRGYLPGGSSDDPTIYNILDDTGASKDVPVVGDDVTAVVVIDYYVPVTASLTVSKVLCTEGDDEEGTFITISDSEGDNGGDGCAPADGEFSLEEQAEVTAQDSITFSLGGDGVWTANLPVGHYLLTDLASGESADVDLTEGASVFAAVRTVSHHGTLVVRHYFCDDPASNEADSTDFSYWDDNCPAPYGGVELTLYDVDGNPVDTETGSAGGTITWQSVDPGTYTVDSDSGLCAAFVDGVDVRDGFNVEAGATTLVRVYTCAAPDNGDGTGGNDDTGDGTGDDTSADNSGEVSDVTTLPQTGAIGTPTDGTNAEMLALLALTLPVLIAGAAAARRRTR